EYGYESVLIERIGRIPAPLDVTVTMLDGTVKKYYIPLDIQRGEKSGNDRFSDFKVMDDWHWVKKIYKLQLGLNTQEIKSIELDASLRLADVNRADNVFPRQSFHEEDMTK